MNIETLVLKNFRNYDNEVISFNNGINIIYGNNAQGKTNILEAIYISSTGKSHRTNNYNELIKYEKAGFELSLNSCIREKENDIKIKYYKEKGKFVEINGVKRNKISDILGNLNMILFSPESLEIVKGVPSERRKFLDILLCQTNKTYLYSLQQYNMLIKNKALALRKNKTENKYNDIFPIWNDQIAKLGGKIIIYRLEAIKTINKFMKNEVEQISNGREKSTLFYKTFCEVNESCTEEYIVEKLNEKLYFGLKREIELSQCLYGPHRDDFEILLNDKNSRQYSSQGQQRTLALSLIISEVLYIEETKGEKPVLLLDDVMSELDIKRQEYLINGLYDVQTIITTTDNIPYKNIKGRSVNHFYIEKGTITSIS